MLQENALLPVTSTILESPQEQIRIQSQLLKAMGNFERLQILFLLKQSDEKSVGDLVSKIGLSQSALSQHLARLRSEGLVQTRRNSQTIYYRLVQHNDMYQILEMFDPSDQKENLAA